MLIILLVPLLSLSQITEEPKIDSMEAIINSGSFRIQFSFSPLAVDESKGEFIYHVIRYEESEGKIYSIYYRQQYMDGELSFVNKRSVERNELVEIKEFVKDRIDHVKLIAWDIIPIAVMYIKKDSNILFSCGVLDKDREWLASYFEKLQQPVPNPKN